MIRFKKNGLEWLQFSHLSEVKKIAHGIFTRHGGISEGNVSSLNFGSINSQGAFFRDIPSNIYHNKTLVKQVLNIKELYSSYQCHDINIILENESPYQHTAPNTGDGLITSNTQVGLLINHADCQAAIMYDPINHAVANIHCGWRGNVKNIYQNAIQRMQSCFGSKPENLLVGISPSLGPQAAEFRNYQKELPESFWQHQIKPTYFNLWEISREQLKAAGILVHHIEIAEICTYNNPQDWFSYRYNKDSGRNATVAALL